MPVLVNLRHLDAHNVKLSGELPAAELDIDSRDEVIQVRQPLKYDLEVQEVEDGLLVQGELRLNLDCECVRCLKAFQYPLVLSGWAAHVPLQGDDATPVTNDCVDLTPVVREDILLEFPQHPLCDRDCGGLPKAAAGQTRNHRGAGQPAAGSSAWAELNKLKL
jgi:uncharacterized protein